MVPTCGKAARDHKQVVASTMVQGATTPVDLDTDKMSFQYSIGSAKYPDNACLGVAEAYHRLKQAVGTAFDHEDFSITPGKFMNAQAVFGIDLEKAGDQALYTGISTREGKVMLLNVKNSPAGPAADKIHEVFVVQVFDGIVNIRRAAVDVEE